MIGIDPQLLEVTILSRDLESDLDEIGDFQELVNELRTFSEHATELMGFKHQVNIGAGQLKVAIIGDFSAGKSTLINSLIGQDLCPVNAKPTTSSLSRFRWNNQPRVFRIEQGQEQEISFEEYHNSVQHGDDATKSQAYEFIVEYPYEVLRDLEIIDTPGFGNQQNAKDTELTKYHAASADVTLFLSDISKGELGSDTIDTLREIKGKQSIRGSWLLILNKADKKPPNARVRIKEKLAEAYSDLFDEIIPYSATWANQMNPKSKDYWVYSLQEKILNQSVKGSEELKLEIISNKKEYMLVLNNQEHFLIAHNGTDHVKSAAEMQLKFTSLSKQKRLLFKRMLEERTEQFCKAGEQLLNLCDRHLLDLDNEERRDEVNRQENQVWDCVVQVCEHENEAIKDHIRQKIANQLKAIELSKHEKDFWFDAYAAHIIENPTQFIDSLSQTTFGIKEKIETRLEGAHLYKSHVFDAEYQNLNEELKKSMYGAALQALHYQDGSGFADHWPAWPSEGLPQKYLLRGFETLDEAKSSRQTNINFLTEEIMNRYINFLIQDLKECTLAYASKLSGATGASHEALIGRADFARDKLNSLRSFLKVIYRGDHQ